MGHAGSEREATLDGLQLSQEIGARLPRTLQGSDDLRVPRPGLSPTLLQRLVEGDVDALELAFGLGLGREEGTRDTRT